MNLINVTRKVWLGLAATLIVLAGAILVEWWFGPVYGVWGWRQMAITVLVLLVTGASGLEALARQPNPYSRAGAQYELRDIAPHTSLESGGTGWILQAVPALIAIVVLGGSFFLA